MTNRRKGKAPTRALARRSSPARPIARSHARQVVEAGAMGAWGESSNQTGALGLVEVKLTKREEAVLSRPVNVEDVLIKPTGQPYISHPTYTKWMNDAFGRLGWAIVPRANPVAGQQNRVVVVTVPYVLYIHGKPAAFAVGEHEYYDSNREQTYGDAVEATVASALRRCMKRLGIGAELWNREWLDRFIAARCVRVVRDHNGERKYAWRLKSSRPFADEASREVEDERVAGSASSGAVGRSSWPDKSSSKRKTGDISEPQHRRLWAIIWNSGRDEDVVKNWIKDQFGVRLSHKYEQETAETGGHLQRADYDWICQAIEDPKSNHLPDKPRTS